MQKDNKIDYYASGSFERAVGYSEPIFWELIDKNNGSMELGQRMTVIPAVSEITAFSF